MTARNSGKSPLATQKPPIEQTALDRYVAEIADRDEMASEYARLLNLHGPEWPTWPALNLAIMDRWSASGLSYIKTKAWKRVR